MPRITNPMILSALHDLPAWYKATIPNKLFLLYESGVSEKEERECEEDDSGVDLNRLCVDTEYLFSQQGEILNFCVKVRCGS